MLINDFIRLHTILAEEYTHTTQGKSGAVATPTQYEPGKFTGDAIHNQGNLGYTPGHIDKEIRSDVGNEDKNFMLKIANEHTKEKFGHPIDTKNFSGSSLRRQYAVAQAGKLAEDGHPEYEKAVFDDYKQNQPDVVGSAHDYKSLVDNAYHAVKNETMEQFHKLPLKITFHPGNLNYHDSNELFRDMHLHHHIATFQGGDPHEHLHEIHPTLGVSSNDIFRVVHDAYGHGVTGVSFGPVYSPLAKIAVSGETRRQNSLVNYSNQNLDLINHMENLRKEKNAHLENKDYDAANEVSSKLREAGGNWQYAKQKSCVLPSVMNEPHYNGDCPDYVKKLIKDPQSDINPAYDVDKDHLHLVKLARTYNTGSHQSSDVSSRGKFNSEQATDDLYHMAKMHGFTSISKFPF